MKFTNHGKKPRGTQSRLSSRYSRKDDQFIVDNYDTMSKSQIAKHLATEKRRVTKNMVISRYTRIKDKYLPQPVSAAPKEKPKAVLPAQPKIKRVTACGKPGCNNQPIKYSSHGLCSTHNADRLAKLPRKNAGWEIYTSEMSSV